MRSVMDARDERGALNPPPGVQTNLVDPPNRNELIFAVSAIAIAITTLLTFLRTYTRMFVMKRRQLEDYVLLAAWFIAVVYFLMMPLGVQYRIGVHQWNVPLSIYYEYTKRSNIADVIYSITSCMFKTAIIVQLWRIFVIGKEGLFWLLAGLGAFNILFYISIIIARLMACLPRKKIWTPDVPGRCINNEAAILSSGIVNVILDLSLLIIPLIRTWKLQMKRSDKFAVLGVFGAGAFACGASIMRLVESVHLLITGDITYSMADVGLWCDAEITTGIVCCCLPVMPRLYRARIATIFSAMKTKFFTSNASASYAPDGSLSKPAVPRSESETEMISYMKSQVEVEALNSNSNEDISVPQTVHFRRDGPTESSEGNAIEVKRVFSVTYGPQS